MVKENHYKMWCQSSYIHEKKQTPPLSHWDFLLSDTWHQKYTFSHYNTIKKKDMTQTQANASVFKKRQTWWVPASMESRHFGWIDSSVYGFCFCAASLPHHNLTSWPLRRTVYHWKPNCAGSDSAETSHTCQPIPFEPTQKLEFVVPLCNAMTGCTWMTDQC